MKLNGNQYPLAKSGKAGIVPIFIDRINFHGRGEPKESVASPHFLLASMRVSCDEYKSLIWPSLHYITKMKQLFQIGATFEVDKCTLLLHAVQVGSVDLVQLILDVIGGSFYNPSLPDYEQPLWVAASNFGTDYGYEITRLLLEKAHLTPWLYDARGVRLLESIWCGMWYYTQSDIYQPHFLISENRGRIMKLIHSSMTNWTPARHFLYPADFRRRIKCFLMCTRFCRDVRQLIIRWIAVAESEPQIEEALQNYRNVDLTRVLKIRSARLPRKRCKLSLMETANRVFREESVEHDRIHREICASPGVIGRVRVERGGGQEEKWFDVHMPWLTLGRAQLFNHPAISRVHVMIRKKGAEWQVRVLGPNGIASQGMWHLPPQDWFPCTEFEIPYAALKLTFTHSSPQ